MDKEQVAKPTFESKSSAGETAQQKKDYIGCVMSLISKQEIRYVGTLIAINSKDQTLVLQNVKSHGSEGRRGGGNEEIPALNQVYGKVSFRAIELKDFYVIEGPGKTFKDPAIVSEKVEEKREEVKTSLKPAASFSAEEQPPEVEFNKYQEHHQAREYNAPRRSRYRQRGRGRPEGRFDEHSVKEVQDKYADEFDFEKMNKKFEELFKEKEEDVEVGETYDKAKSFYDNISRSKEEKSEIPFDRHKQREIDAATFDFDPDQAERRGGYYPRYRGGRWRGGYRRGRGQQNYGRRGQQQYYRRRG